METWKSIARYEGLYEVSNLGRVRSLKFGKTKILKPADNGGGYLYVQLCKDGIRKNMFVHRLVASAFMPNPQNLDTVNHKDEDKHNNNVSNLEWMSRTDNIAYSRPQLAERPVQQLDKETGKLLATFPSLIGAARVTGISEGNIVKCCRCKLKSAGGYLWRYVD